MIKNSSIYLVFIFLLLSSYSELLFCQEKHPSLTMQGETYLNACLDDEKNMLKRDLQELRYPDEEKAWKLIDTILCADNNEFSRSYIKNLILDKLRREDSTGTKPRIKLMPKNDDVINKVLASGKAWSPSVRISEVNVNQKEIVLRYFPNEACIKDIKIRHVKNKWILYEVAEACD